MFLFLSKATGALVAAALLLFTARRWVYLWAAGWRALPAPPPPDPLPAVLLLVPARDEAANLPACVDALAVLDYPPDRLRVVFVDDGSRDDGHRLLADRVAARPGWALLRLPAGRGKAAALNAALDRFPEGELVVVVDADDRPAPDALRALVRPFADPAVGAVTGRRRVANPLASPAAGQAALEALVHQEITLRARDRLDLAPPLLGSNCAYRRAALDAMGGFTPGALLEDSDLTVRLALAGWRLRFAPAALSRHEAPVTFRAYWRQHTRWAHGFGDVAGAHLGPVLRQPGLRLALRLELVLFSLGYLDRAALLAGLVLWPLAPGPLGMAIALYLIMPVVQVIVALRRDGTAAPWRAVVWLPAFLALEGAMALTGLARAALRRPRVWRRRVVPA